MCSVSSQMYEYDTDQLDVGDEVEDHTGLVLEAEHQEEACSGFPDLA